MHSPVIFGTLRTGQTKTTDPTPHVSELRGDLNQRVPMHQLRATPIKSASSSKPFSEPPQVGHEA